MRCAIRMAINFSVAFSLENLLYCLAGAALWTLFIALVGPPLGEWALAFGPWEYCALMLMGLVGSAVLAQGDAVKGLAMVALSLLLGVAGADVNSRTVRYAFGVAERTFRPGAESPRG